MNTNYIYLLTIIPIIGIKYMEYDNKRGNEGDLNLLDKRNILKIFSVNLV